MNKFKAEAELAEELLRERQSIEIEQRLGENKQRKHKTKKATQ